VGWPSRSTARRLFGCRSESLVARIDPHGEFFVANIIHIAHTGRLSADSCNQALQNLGCKYEAASMRPATNAKSSNLSVDCLSDVIPCASTWHRARL
jgi:hypothetical protein